MKKVQITILYVFLISIILAGCLEKEIDKREPIDFNKSYSFNVASVYNENTYFINENNKLYKANNDFSGIEEYLDEEMQLFTFTEKYLLFVDMLDKLHIVYLEDNTEKIYEWQFDESVRTSKGFSYTTIADSIIYEDRIIYRTKEEMHLACLFFDNLEHKIITKDEIMNITSYKDRIVYSIRQNKFFVPYLLEEYTPSDESFNLLGEHYVYLMESYEDYIYYVNNYSIYRLSMVTGERELLILDSSTLSFQVSDSKIMCSNSQGLVLTDLDGTNSIVLDEKRNIFGVANSNNDTFIYSNSESSYFAIYGESIDKKIYYDNSRLNCVFLDDLLFMRFGTREDNKIDVKEIAVYDLLGNLIYNNYHID